MAQEISDLGVESVDPPRVSAGAKRQRRIFDPSGCIYPVSSQRTESRGSPLSHTVHTNGKNSVMSIRSKASIRRLRRESKMQISCCIQERGFKVFTGHVVIENVMEKQTFFHGIFSLPVLYFHVYYL